MPLKIHLKLHSMLQNIESMHLELPLLFNEHHTNLLRIRHICIRGLSPTKFASYFIGIFSIIVPAALTFDQSAPQLIRLDHCSSRAKSIAKYKLRLDDPFENEIRFINMLLILTVLSTQQLLTCRTTAPLLPPATHSTKPSSPPTTSASAAQASTSPNSAKSRTTAALKSRLLRSLPRAKTTPLRMRCVLNLHGAIGAARR